MSLSVNGLDRPVHEKVLLIAVESQDLETLTTAAIEGTGFSTRSAKTVKEILARLARGESLMAVVELALLGKLAGRFLDTIKHIHPAVALILLARNPLEAYEAGVQVGGCVYHLFIEIPTPQELNAFLISARDKQHRASRKTAARYQ